MKAPTVIVPLDTSIESESSLATAEALARRTEGMLLLVSIIEAPSDVGVWLDAHKTIDAWVDRHMEVDDYLTQTASKIQGIPVDTLVSTGNPSVEINAIAKGQADSVIVLASHARTGLSRVAIGSVATSVIHDASSPVVVVRRNEERKSGAESLSLDTILIALDGSDFAEEALAAARAVLGSSGLNLHLLRVIETMKWYGSTYAEVDYGVLELYVDAERETASTYLEGLANRLREAGNDVSWEVRQGLVPTHIGSAAEKVNAGLIVIATHGRTGLGRIFMGSVAERVIHDAERPVMLVNPQVTRRAE